MVKLVTIEQQSIRRRRRRSAFESVHWIICTTCPHAPTSGPASPWGRAGSGSSAGACSHMPPPPAGRSWGETRSHLPACQHWYGRAPSRAVAHPSFMQSWWTWIVVSRPAAVRLRGRIGKAQKHLTFTWSWFASFPALLVSPRPPFQPARRRRSLHAEKPTGTSGTPQGAKLQASPPAPLL
ncbi:hypothetical protein VDGL01_06136 [Verticillium dahliae]